MKGEMRKIIVYLMACLLLVSLFTALLFPVFISANENVVYKGRDVVEAAMTHLGKPYIYGASREQSNSFDCSSLVYYTLKNDLGLTEIEGFGSIPVATGWNGDNGHSWKTLQDNHQVGDIITFTGNGKTLKYKVALIEGKFDCTSAFYEKPGTLIITHGHIVIGLGRYNLEDDVKNYLEDDYGVDLSGNTEQSFPVFNKVDNGNQLFRIEALGSNSGTCYGVIVSNYTVGMISENVAMVLEPMNYQDVTVVHAGLHTGSPITETEFGLYKAYEDAELERNPVEHFVTDETGKYSFKLSIGTYYLKPISHKDDNFTSSEIKEIYVDKDMNVLYLEEEKYRPIIINGYENLKIRIFEYSQKFNNYISVGEIKRDEFGNTYIDNYKPRTSDRFLEDDNKFYYTEDNQGKLRIEGVEIIFNNEYQVNYPADKEM